MSEQHPRDLEQERIYLNQRLLRRMPFLFEGFDPRTKEVIFPVIVMSEYAAIEAKKSDLPATQRKVVVDYVEGMQAFIKKQEEAVSEIKK